MQTTVTARNFDASPKTREEAREATEKFTRFFDNIISTEVILLNEDTTKDHHMTVEYIVRVQGHTVVIEEKAETFSKALHDGAERVVRQLRKLKEKSQNH